MAVGDTFENSGRVYRVEFLVPPVVRIVGPQELSSSVAAADLYGSSAKKVERWSPDGKGDDKGVYIIVDLKTVASKWRPYFEQSGTRVPESAVGTGLAIELKLGQYANEAAFMRGLYFEGAQRIQGIAFGLLKNGRLLEDVARWVVRARNVLKVQVRLQGPAVFKKWTEVRNVRKYGNPVGPSYERLRVRYSDEEIIGSKVTQTSRAFNRAPGILRMIGVTAQVATFVLAAQQDSPEGLPALPDSEEELVQIEATRLKLGIPADANIDSHGHLKKNSYMQIDVFDVHAADEMDQETEEILWFFGMPLTYSHGGVTWTVPGKQWRKN